MVFDRILHYFHKILLINVSFGKSTKTETDDIVKTIIVLDLPTIYMMYTILQQFVNKFP